MLKSTAIILITMSIALSGCQSWKRVKQANSIEDRMGGAENIDPKTLSDTELCLLATNAIDQSMWSGKDRRRKFIEEAVSRKTCPAYHAMVIRKKKREQKELALLVKNKCENIATKVYPPVIEEKIEIRKRTINVGEECLVPNMPRPTDMYDQSKHVDCLLSRDRTETFNEPFKTRVDRNKENRSTAERACISEHQAKLRSGADINSSDFWNMNY